MASGPTSTRAGHRLTRLVEAATTPLLPADYLDLGGVAVAAKQGLNVALSSGSASTYVAVVSGGTGTYTASGITLRLGIIQD